MRSHVRTHASGGAAEDRFAASAFCATGSFLFFVTIVIFGIGVVFAVIVSLGLRFRFGLCLFILVGVVLFVAVSRSLAVVWLLVIIFSATCILFFWIFFQLFVCSLCHDSSGLQAQQVCERHRGRNARKFHGFSGGLIDFSEQRTKRCIWGHHSIRKTLADTSSPQIRRGLRISDRLNRDIPVAGGCLYEQLAHRIDVALEALERLVGQRNLRMPVGFRISIL